MGSRSARAASASTSAPEKRARYLAVAQEKAAALAAYVQCVARWLSFEQPFRPQEDDYLVYTFNRFQAC
ncbi:MAG TPA: hypothetical protein PK788_09450, partial [Gemmatimonadaceae bacterium]|nr:hypothetical protein [Gemmatimonadaceae bacterium]